MPRYIAERNAEIDRARSTLQPTLVSYSLGRPAAPVALESSSLAPDRMLLLDTYQQIILLSGAGRALY